VAARLPFRPVQHITKLACALRNVVPNIILELKPFIRPTKDEVRAQRWSMTMSENVRLSLKLNIVCLLLFLNGAAAVIHHPNWFQ
jgi:hypothetical protein